MPFAHLAARIAVGLIVLATAIAAAHDIFGWRHLDIQRSDWIGLLAVVAAVTILLWDRESRFSLAGLYALGLTAVGMALCARNLGSGRYFLWVASCEIAGFVLVAAICGWLLPRGRRIWHMSADPGTASTGALASGEGRR